MTEYRMKNDFLQYLDKKQRNWIKKNHIENSKFIDYTELESGDLNLEETYYIAKSRKARILLMHEDIWIDLTDYDLIWLFCKMDDNTVKRLLCDLKEGYEGHWKAFRFQLDHQDFKGVGIDYNNYELSREVQLEADFSVKLQDILFIFNMVLYKDIVGEHYRQKKRPITIKLIETTIMKYISLILYYRFDDDTAKQYLADMEYPLCEWGNLLDHKMKMKKYDRCFKKNGFEKLLDLC